MFRAPRLLLAFLLGTGAVAVEPAVRLMAASETDKVSAGNLKRAAATADIPFRDFDFQAEQQLLQLANESRAQAGLGALSVDAGLSRAARIHAQLMLEQGRLSHQFGGEPGLDRRIAAESALHMGQEGENVAFDVNAEQGHEHLMLSPPHRANLLNPGFNVVGLGAIRDGDRLYIVEDFGYALPNYSASQVKEVVAAGVNEIRRRANKPELQRRDLLVADDAACSMAQADKLGTSPIRQLADRYTVLTYTSLRPEALPAGANQVLTRAYLQSFSVGVCYAHSETYPTGVYWIVLSLN